MVCVPAQGTIVISLSGKDLLIGRRREHDGVAALPTSVFAILEEQLYRIPAQESFAVFICRIILLVEGVNQQLPFIPDVTEVLHHQIVFHRIQFSDADTGALDTGKEQIRGLRTDRIPEGRSKILS